MGKACSNSQTSFACLANGGGIAESAGVAAGVARSAAIASPSEASDAWGPAAWLDRESRSWYGQDVLLQCNDTRVQMGSTCSCSDGCSTHRAEACDATARTDNRRIGLAQVTETSSRAGALKFAG